MRTAFLTSYTISSASRDKNVVLLNCMHDKKHKQILVVNSCKKPSC